MSADRVDGRAADELRPVTFELGVQEFAEGSVLVSFGRTRVLCAASVEEEVPRWMRGTRRGWVTAEYGMLPRATSERMRREAARGRPSGRTQEIQRLIGRALRSVIDLEQLGERMVSLDCDVLQADGGTRTASITGAWVALSLALDATVKRGDLARRPRLDTLAAVSVGIVEGRPLLDLCYTEDAAAQVDMNVVLTGDGRFVELQGTAEEHPFSADELAELLRLGALGCTQLVALQEQALSR